MSPKENKQINKTAGQMLISCLALASMTLMLSGCSMLTGGLLGGGPLPNREGTVGGGILKGLRPTADPALVERIREKELKDAQTTIASQTAGPQMMQPGLGRNLPNVSTDPLSGPMNGNSQTSVNSTIFTATNQDPSNNAFANPNPQLATYESAYNTVPPPPPGSLAAGLVPPPPAVTLSTQAQAYPSSAADFYNNPYFNPYGVPAPPQAALPPERRPAGLFGDGSTHNQTQYNSEKASPKHRTDFVPITPTGMESRSPYKQRDDLRVLWRAALKDSNDAGAIADNKRLMETLTKLDVGLPSDSSRGSFNISSRQVESIFKSSSIDRRAFAEVRKLQTDLVQSYYRYLCAYNKYALAEQTTAARQQEVDLSDSDLERQKGTADLAQAKNDLDSAKDDMRSAELELAAASSPSAARTIISRVAGIAPSIESLAQGSQNNRVTANHGNGITSVFDSVFHHNHNSEATETISDESSNDNSKDSHKNHSKKHTAIASDADKNKAKKSIASNNEDDENFLSKLFANKNSKPVVHHKNSQSEEISQSNDSSDLTPAPVTEKNKSADNEDSNDVTEVVTKVEPSGNSSISFQLKGVNIKPRKSVLTVAVKNSSSEAYELNPDAISISEGNHKLATADMRADFDMTSIQPDHEVKGTITVFGHPWNDRLLVYLNDGNKKIQLKR